MASKKSTKPTSETRTRTWTLVVYPESLPDHWESILDELHIEWIRSPLHDLDLNATGEVKKPHYHLLLIFTGVKSYDQVNELCSALNCPIPQRCHNAKAMVRYMAHLDNPDKHQYSIADIKCYGGADVSDFLRPSASERYSIINDIIEFVKSEHIIEFQDLLDYARYNEFDTWFVLLCDNSSFVVNQYIKSQRHRLPL